MKNYRYRIVILAFLMCSAIHCFAAEDKCGGAGCYFWDKRECLWYDDTDKVSFLPNSKQPIKLTPQDEEKFSGDTSTQKYVAKNYKVTLTKTFSDACGKKYDKNDDQCTVYNYRVRILVVGPKGKKEYRGKGHCGS